jgi:transcription termination factor Rho
MSEEMNQSAVVTADEETKPSQPAPLELPKETSIDDLHRMPHGKLLDAAARYRVRSGPDRSRHHIILDLVRFYLMRGVQVSCEGILEGPSEGSGYLRWPKYNFAPCPEDVYVPAPVVRQFALRPGNRVAGKLRLPRDKERGLVLGEVTSVEGLPPGEAIPEKDFEHLTATFPRERIVLENQVTKSLSARVIDLMAPLGKGQRGLIVAPPRVGKTILLKEIAKSIRATSPKIHLILLLVDERPEEVTDLRRSVDAEIFCSTFDESATRHVQVSELVNERAKRLVELKKDVVILIDSITRLARGYNNLQPNKGRIMSGGVDAKALLKPKRFFGSARNVEEGGSLTILGTALVETESRMDEVIFEEFKGTGNMELHLDRGLAERRIFPALHILNSATRRDDLLYHPDEYARIQVLRKQLAALPPMEAMETLLRALRSTRTNAELLLTGLR